ncbi:type II toxin-antitoxin system VapB family antitoxin [Crenothrix sp.]|uniref:type II toxin-antitoxin system VapB family antitoxin n=1 Tax=Crenothrix sp. TaxID=3100433 RepID=UPI00374D796B
MEKPTRTNIIIDDTLMADVLKVTGVKSKQQEGIKAFKGKLSWEGDLEQMRTDQ